MDTNFFAAAVLGRVMDHRRLNDSEAEVMLGWLQRNLFMGADRIRWKGIYLLVELTNIIDDIQSRPAYIVIKQSLEIFRNERKATGKPFADPDWNQRREELMLCGLEPVSLSALRGSSRRGERDSSEREGVSNQLCKEDNFFEDIFRNRLSKIVKFEAMKIGTSLSSRL